MSACRWSQDAGDYLTDDGQPCRHDEYGDPTRHCTAKRGCSHHIGPRELTCARCINDTRNNLNWIPDLATLLTTEALNDGAHSEAAMLAGPAADYPTFSARRALNRRWLYQHIPNHNLSRAITALLPDDDDAHPFNVLTRWHWDVSLAYNDPLPEVMTTAGSATYLTRNLNRIAHDPDMEFYKLRSQAKKVREHLEAVIHNSTGPEKGAPCPECVADGIEDGVQINPADVRLRREYAYWSYEGEEKGWRLRHRTSPDPGDESEGQDRWVCPRDKAHVWGESEYRRWIEERTASA